MILAGKYRLLYKIAQGGMAEIFAATVVDSPDSHRELICIKRIRPEYSDDPEFERMFTQEAKIAMALNHPNVVRVFDFDKHEGRLFLAMEYVEGWDLKKVISAAKEMRVALPIGFAFHVFRGLLGALEAANRVVFDGKEQAVVHRDISPHNLLLAKDGTIKLTDFGIAKARGSSRITATGIIKGKLAYLSPEQASANRIEVGPASDLYGAGLVLYELLAMRRFHYGNNESEILILVMNPGPPQIHWLSQEINDFLAKILAKQIDDRFPSPSAALAAMEKLALPAYEQDAAAALMSGLITSGASDNTNSFEAVRTGEETAAPQDVDAVLETNAITRAYPMDTDSLVVFRKNWKWVLGFGIGLGVMFLLILLGFFFSQEMFGEETSSSGHFVESAKSPRAQKVVTVQEEISKIPPVVDEQKKQNIVPNGLPTVPDDKSVTSKDKPVRSKKRSVLPKNRRVAQKNKSIASKQTVERVENERSAVADKRVSQDTQRDNPSTEPQTSSSEISSVVEEGQLQVLCRPWARVYIDGTLIGTTPISRRTLSVGEHVVRLVNNDMDFDKTELVVIRPEKLTRLSERIGVQ